MKKSHQRAIAVLLAVALIFGAYPMVTGQTVFAGATAQAAKKTTKGYKVLRVVDGDTFKMKYQGEEVYVRLTGVDTPESVHSDESRNTKWGKKASKFTTKKLEGQTVYLEFDTDKYDQYGRLLAYVYTKKNGKKVMFNETLLKKGYARVYYDKNNKKYESKFVKLEKKAKKAKKGFWKKGLKAAFPYL